MPMRNLYRQERDPRSARCGGCRALVGSSWPISNTWHVYETREAVQYSTDRFQSSPDTRLARSTPDPYPEAFPGELCV